MRCPTCQRLFKNPPSLANHAWRNHKVSHEVITNLTHERVKNYMRERIGPFDQSLVLALKFRAGIRTEVYKLTHLNAFKP